MDQVQAPAPVKSGMGVGKIILVIVAVLLVLGIGGVFVYARYFNKPGSILSKVVPKTLNPNCKYNDPDLCKFMNNWPNVEDMTMTMSSTFEGKATQTIFKMDGKNKDEMESTTGGKGEYHTISIDKTNYVLDYSDNKWWKYTSSDTETSEIKETEDLVDFNSAEDKSTYKKIGKEGCGKLTCFKYQVVDPENNESTEYIYFDDREYLLRKTRSEGKDGSVSESVISYENVNISAPSPTKDGNPYSANIPTTAPSTPSTSGSYSTSDLEKALQDAANQINSIGSDASADTSGDSTSADEPAE